MNLNEPDLAGGDDGGGESIWPSVTINVLAFNRKDIVHTTLSMVTNKLDYPADRLEIILVDNGSTDGTREMVAAEFPCVKVVVIEKNRGVSGWNEGFEAGGGDYFLVLDDDCYLVGDSLKRAVESAEIHGADLVSFLVSSPYEENFFFNQTYNTGILSFWGCSALISREAIERLGGFDRNIFVGTHELEFTVRLLGQGMKHLFLPEVVSYHMKKLSWRHSFDVAFWIINLRNLSYIAGKLFQPGDAILAFLNLVCRLLLMARHHPRVSAALPRMCQGFWHGLRLRAPVRDNVSAVYRKNFNEFVNPLPFLRNPAKQENFYAGRPQYYPVEKAILEL
ncbi:MAG: glycosyltransferase [Acidobacteria bacterium]|nr:glycosyltransferase [Acidobacteriota bacterium]